MSISNRLQQFIASRHFNNLPEHSLSAYWTYFHGGMKIVSQEGNVSVAGGSGLYEPTKARSKIQKLSSLITSPKLYGHIVLEQLLRRGFRKFGMEGELVAMPGDLAFDAIHTHALSADVDLSPWRLNFRKIGAASGSFPNSEQVRLDFALSGTSAEPTVHIYQAYYYVNILNYLSLFNDMSFLEIGAGNGNLARLLIKRATRTSYIVDLPKTLVGSIEFLTRTNPRLKVVLPHEVESGFEGADLVFLTPAQIGIIPDRSVSLSVNVASFQEMRRAQIAEYFELVDRVSADKAHLFSLNRVEKIPGDESINRKESKEDVIRAAEFPWRANWTPVVRENCRFSRLTSRDNCELRVVQVQH